MKKTLAIALTAAALGVTTAPAFNELDISVTADGSSQFIDYFSNAYAQIDLTPDGMYTISTTTLLGSGVNGFANNGVWNSLGSLVLDGNVTGTGVENFNIIGSNGFDFDSVIDGAAFSVVGDYSTSISGVSGTATVTNGLVTSLAFSSSITFEFLAAPGAPYVGTLSITESSFDLFVDDDTINFGSPVRQAWDVEGSTTSIQVIPEPSSLLLIALGVGMGVIRRRSPRAAA